MLLALRLASLCSLAIKWPRPRCAITHAQAQRAGRNTLVGEVHGERITPNRPRSSGYADVRPTVLCAGCGLGILKPRWRSLTRPVVRHLSVGTGKETTLVRKPVYGSVQCRLGPAEHHRCLIRTNAASMRAPPYSIERALSHSPSVFFSINSSPPSCAPSETIQESPELYTSACRSLAKSTLR